MFLLVVIIILIVYETINLVSVYLYYWT